MAAIFFIWVMPPARPVSGWLPGSAAVHDGAVSDERWAAVNDRVATGDFVYAVRTTGIVCRVGCASRRPRRENVVFYDDVATAERAGFRPCRRCR